MHPLSSSTSTTLTSYNQAKVFAGGSSMAILPQVSYADYIHPEKHPVLKLEDNLQKIWANQKKQHSTTWWGHWINWLGGWGEFSQSDSAEATQKAAEKIMSSYKIEVSINTEQRDEANKAAQALFFEGCIHTIPEDFSLLIHDTFRKTSTLLFDKLNTSSLSLQETLQKSSIIPPVKELILPSGPRHGVQINYAPKTITACTKDDCHYDMHNILKSNIQEPAELFSYIKKICEPTTHSNEVFCLPMAIGTEPTTPPYYAFKDPVFLKVHFMHKGKTDPRILDCFAKHINFCKENCITKDSFPKMRHATAWVPLKGNNFTEDMNNKWEITVVTPDQKIFNLWTKLWVNYASSYMINICEHRAALFERNEKIKEISDSIVYGGAATVAMALGLTILCCVKKSCDRKDASQKTQKENHLFLDVRVV